MCNYGIHEVNHMKRKKLSRILEDFYTDTICIDVAWGIYLNFLKLYKCADEDTIEYMYKLSIMTQKEILGWRNELAERGFELTPNEADQYILIVALVLHITKPDIHKRG